MVTDYVDSAWGMGYSKFELVPGIDCSSTASFFDADQFSELTKFKSSLCLFEVDLGLPLRRHFDNNFEGGYKFYGRMPGSTLVLRSASTACNYDYIYYYLFHPNGVMEVGVSTSGHVQATLWTSHEASYGNDIHAGVAGTIYDHLINEIDRYKVDLDFGGRKNSFETVDIKVENIKKPFIITILTVPSTSISSAREM